MMFITATHNMLMNWQSCYYKSRGNPVAKPDMWEFSPVSCPLPAGDSSAGCGLRRELSLSTFAPTALLFFEATSASGKAERHRRVVCLSHSTRY
eukprot:scaffold514537_cov33-Prasinocladus_malaysianus.AAC.1